MKAVLILLLFLSHTAVFSNSEEKAAGKLVSQATSLMRHAQLKSKQYSSVYNNYQKAQETINQLITEYSSTETVHNLLYGKTTINGLSFEQFEQLAYKLEPLVDAEKSPLATAQFLIDTLEDSEIKILPLLEMHQVYLSRDPIEAKRLLSVALSISDKGQNLTDKALNTIRIAESYADSGDEEVALRLLLRSFDLIRDTDNSAKKHKVMSGLARVYHKLGKQKNLFKIAKSIKTNYVRSQIENNPIIDMITANAKSGDFSQALKITDALSIGVNKITALNQIADIYLSIGKLKEMRTTLIKAYDISVGIDSSFEKSWVLVKIAKVYMKADLENQANELLEKSLTLSSEVMSEKEQHVILEEILLSYAGQKNFEKVSAVLALIKVDRKPVVLDKLTDVYANLGLMKKKKKPKVSKQARNKQKVGLLVVKIDKLLRKGANDRAYRIVRRSKFAHQSKTLKERLLKKVALAYSKAGLFSKAIICTQRIKNVPTQASILASISKDYVQKKRKPTLGDKKKLREMVQKIKPMNTFWNDNVSFSKVTQLSVQDKLIKIISQ
ncbi:MAG: hypothetical protein V3U71_13420 [Cocleimonas sp.]